VSKKGNNDAFNETRKACRLRNKGVAIAGGEH